MGGDHTHQTAHVECISTVIPQVVASAAEAEYAACYIVGTSVARARATLEDLGFPQPTHPGTPLFTDNNCAKDIAARLAKQRRSKAMDMRYHWVRDRMDQGQHDVRWCKGSENVADYLTKAHPVHMYEEMRHLFVDV